MARLRSIAIGREGGIALGIAALVAILGAIEPRILTGEAASILLLTVPLVLVGAAGQLLVIISRHVDISMGSILGLSAIVAGMAFRDLPGLPVAGGFAIGIGVGAAAGLVNALLVTRLGLHSIIVTLGTLNIFRGLAFIVADGRQVSAQELPEALLALGRPAALGIPAITLLALLALALAHGVLRHTGLGRALFAVGSNPQAAHLRGVRVTSATSLAFALSGAAAGLAGVMYAARFGVVNASSAGVGYELTVIAAVIVGGASIAGGVGSAFGAGLGVLLVGVIEVALPMLGVARVWQDVLFGLIILAALAADRIVTGRLFARGAREVAP